MEVEQKQNSGLHLIPKKAPYFIHTVGRKMKNKLKNILQKIVHASTYLSPMYLSMCLLVHKLLLSLLAISIQTQSKTTLQMFSDNQQISIKSLYNEIAIQCGFLKMFGRICNNFFEISTVYLLK